MAEAFLDFNLLEPIAVLIWANTGNSHMAEKLAIIKLAADLWKKFNGVEAMDALRAETVASISKYIEEHPRDSQEQLLNEIKRQILDFASKVESM
ncbi:hypothetical protein BsWGS_14941 [Bradybaena similaris]